MKLYTVAGASVQDGKFSYRFANSHDRAKVLARAGHSWVKLFTLPQPMFKEDAARWLDDNYPNLVAESASDSKLMERVIQDVQKGKETVLWRSLSPAQRADAQFEIWRYKAKEKHDFLVD
jgi:hypothetical protein